MPVQSGLQSISDKNSETLVLGSFPGTMSLDLGQYYAHPRNIFWQLAADIFDFEAELVYLERVQKLKQKRVALWDVLQTCVRVGSADQNIQNPVPNDFPSFFKKRPNLSKVVFNGRKAERLFRSLIPRSAANHGIEYIYLPSTSPANTRMHYEQKLNIWRNALTG